VATLVAGCAIGCSGGYPDSASSDSLGAASAALEPVGTWTTVAAEAPGPISSLQLLTDGTGMAGDGAASWSKLTPDSNGSYQNGTWTTLASNHLSRLYMPSTILKDGRYWTGGGEYINGVLDSGNQSTVEIYDPVMNTWLQGMDMPDPIGDTA